jgi:hypothetical protein
MEKGRRDQERKQTRMVYVSKKKKKKDKNGLYALSGYSRYFDNSCTK